jgi:hypothetical protein
MFLIGCKGINEKNNTVEGSVSEVVEEKTEVKEESVEIEIEDKVADVIEEKENTVFEWVNLYQNEELMLNEAIRLLKVNREKAISLMGEENKVIVKSNSLYKVFDGLKSTDIKDLLGEDLRKAVIANGGLGVNIRVSVSPNPEEDGADERGNFYSFAIYENYETHMATLAHVVFDVRTLNYYKLETEGSYVVLPCPDSVKKTLANIREN